MTDQGQPGWMPPAPTAPQPPQWQPPAPPYGAPPPPGGWYPVGGGYGYPQPMDTNGFAIASLVCSLVGIIVWFIGPLLGLVFGIIGLNQLQRMGQRGRGLAIAGIVIGGIVLLLNVVAVIGLVTTHSGGGAGVVV